MWFQIELPEPAVVTELQFNSAGGGFAAAERSRRTRQRAGRARHATSRRPLVPAGPYPREYKVEVSTNGTTWTAGGRRTGNARFHDHHVRADTGEVRPHHADGYG